MSIKIENNIPIPSENNKFRSGKNNYKWECINALAKTGVGDSICVEDRINETVTNWINCVKIRARMGTMPEFSGKKFIVREINHNTQRIWRVL